MSTEAATRTTGNPPPWVNSMMTRMLRTPVLQRLIGQGVALITVTGRRTGTRYTFPVSYRRDHNTVMIVTKRERIWWRNLWSKPQVELRLAGRDHIGRASIDLDGDEAVTRLTRFFTNRRVDARAFGLVLTSDGKLDRDQARSLLPRVVIVEITLAGVSE